MKESPIRGVTSRPSHTFPAGKAVDRGNVPNALLRGFALTALIALTPFHLGAQPIDFPWTEGRTAAEKAGSAAEPAWVTDPRLEGFISVVGSAGPQRFGGGEAQRRAALLNAEQQLAQMVRVHVYAREWVEVEEREGVASTRSGSEAELRSRAAIKLREARVVEEWSDPERLVLYLWLAVPE